MSSPSSALALVVPATPSQQGDAALVTEDEFASARCCTCRKPVDEDNSLVIVRQSVKSAETRRCRACHNLRSAVNRLANKHGNLVKDFTQVDGDRVHQFYSDNPHLRGEGLRSKLEDVVTEWKTSTTNFAFTQDGEFLDEFSLTEKYKERPEMLQNILKNARRFWCPVKQCQLYADPTYRARVEDAMEIGKSEKRKGVIGLHDSEPPAPSNERPGGKGNKRKKQLADDSVAEGDQKFKAGEKKKLQKKVDTLDTKQLQLKDLVSKASTYGDMIPAYILKNAEDCLAAATTSVENAKHCIGAMQGDSVSLLKALDQNIDALQTSSTRLRSQIDQAAAFK